MSPRNADEEPDEDEASYKTFDDLLAELENKIILDTEDWEERRWKRNGTRKQNPAKQ